MKRWFTYFCFPCWSNRQWSRQSSERYDVYQNQIHHHKICNPNPILIRAIPEIILGGGPTFFQTPPPPGHTWESEPPRPPGHVNALINPPRCGSNTPWPPRDKLPPTPPPLGHIVNKTHSAYRTKKVPVVPPPPRVMSGTALIHPWQIMWQIKCIMNNTFRH